MQSLRQRILPPIFTPPIWGSSALAQCLIGGLLMLATGALMNLQAEEYAITIGVGNNLRHCTIDSVDAKNLYVHHPAFLRKTGVQETIPLRRVKVIRPEWVQQRRNRIGTLSTLAGGGLGLLIFR